MMQRVFIFLLALALFFAFTGGYGQIINRVWIARSFISADQRAEEYPQLDKNIAYEFHTTDGKTRKHQANTTNQHGDNFAVGFVIEQQGKWITLQGYTSESGQYRYLQRINLDNVCAMYYREDFEN